MIASESVLEARARAIGARAHDWVREHCLARAQLTKAMGQVGELV